jgi:hypothetical protein
MRHFSIKLRMLALGLGIAAMAQTAAQGAIISAGFDLFETDPTTTFVSIGGTAVPLKGVPLGFIGDGDTIVQRTGPTQMIAVGSGTAVFDLQLYALHLHSVAPVTIGGFLYDLDITGGTFFGQVEAITSPGITITQTQSVPHEGGTFSSTLSVAAIIAFTPDNGGPAIAPMNFSDNFTGNGVWSATPRSDDVHSPSFPSGGFNPAVDPTTLGKSRSVEEAMLAAHGVIPAQTTPEPSALAILMEVGVIIGPVYVWRARRRPRHRPGL